MSLAENLLSKTGAKVGDVVRIRDEGRDFEGVLMPRHAGSRPDVLILKLSSGYNVGLACSPKTELTLVKRGEPRKGAARPVPTAADKPLVALLGTGGTIASFVDYRTGAVHPAATAEELAFATGEIFDVANVQPEVIYQVFSEDLEPKNWTELATKVKAAFDRGAKGVVIPHGTDTLGYTAAALSFALTDLPGPVVLVGAQRSSDRPSSDAAGNLLAAVKLAARADLGEVVLVMHASPSDERFQITRGTRARKNHASRRDAFESINTPPLGYVEGDEIRLTQPHHKRGGPIKLRAKFDARVRLVWSSPITAPFDFRPEGVKGIVAAGTGLGHVPRRCLDAVKEATQAGVVVAMTTQCLWGRVGMDVYSTGRDLLARGVVSAEDMLPEVALVKLMWALGQSASPTEATKLFSTPVAGEIADVTPFLEE
jgi:glutamyl-tRNA(Gln) amidotransferase subunit D